MSSRSVVELNPGDELRETANQVHEFGTLGVLADREFRYCRLGATAVTAGKVLQTAANVANHDDDLVVTAAAAGVTAVTVALGATAITADQYKDGYVYFHTSTGTGPGQMFKIGTHPAVASSGAFAVPFAGDQRLVTAVNATTTAGLMIAPHNKVIIAPTTHTGHCVGVTPFDVTADYYFWAQTKGVRNTLIQGTVTIGQEVMRSDGVAGAVEAADAAGTVENQILGTVTLIVNADADYGLIALKID